MRRDGVFASRSAAKLARSSGITHSPSKKVANREGRLDCFNVGHARDRIWQFSAQINPIRKRPCAARPCECLRLDADDIQTLLIHSKQEKRLQTSMPHAGRLAGIL